MILFDRKKTCLMPWVAIVALGIMGCGGGGGSSPDPGTSCGSWPALIVPTDLVGNSMIRSVATLDACNLLISGYDRSNLASDVGGDTRGFIQQVSLDVNGNVGVGWRYWLDTSGSDQVRDAIIDDGKIRFLGETTGSIPGSVNAGKADVLLGNLDMGGTLLSLAQMGTDRPNIPLSLLPQGNGGFLLVGYDDVFVPTNYVEALEDPWVAELSETPDGYLLNAWENANTAEGDFFTAAVSQGDAAILAKNSNGGVNSGISVTKRSSAGAGLWTLMLTSSPYDVVADLHLVNDEKLLVFGTTYTALGGTQLGGGDYFLAEVNPLQGELISVVQFGSSGTDWAKRLLVSGQDVYILGEQAQASGRWSAQVMKLSLLGGPMSSQLFEPGTDSFASDADLIGSGVMMTGYYRDNTGVYRGFMGYVESL